MFCGLPIAVRFRSGHNASTMEPRERNKLRKKQKKVQPREAESQQPKKATTPNAETPDAAEYVRAKNGIETVAISRVPSSVSAMSVMSKSDSCSTCDEREQKLFETSIHLVSSMFPAWECSRTTKIMRDKTKEESYAENNSHKDKTCKNKRNKWKLRHMLSRIHPPFFPNPSGH